MPAPPSMFDEPRAVRPVPRLANYIQPTLVDGLRIWWAFYWRTLLLTYVTAIVLNIGIRAVWSAGLMPSGVTRIAASAVRYDSYPIYYAFAFVALAIVLRKTFRSFRTRLLSNYGAEGAQELPPTFARTARVWWTFCWRAVVYRVSPGGRRDFPSKLDHWLLGRFRSQWARGCSPQCYWTDISRRRGWSFRDLFQCPRRGHWRFPRSARAPR